MADHVLRDSRMSS